MSSYEQSNKARVFQVQLTSQNNEDLATYFTRCQGIWDELSSIREFPRCTCGKCSCTIQINDKLQQFEEESQTLHFLNGLDTSYMGITGQILMTKPFPTLSQAYAILAQEERQRGMSAVTGSSSLSPNLNYANNNTSGIDKAVMEPTFCEMYANFYSLLATELPDLSLDNEKITFRRLLHNKCQEVFERREREEQEANEANLNYANNTTSGIVNANNTYHVKKGPPGPKKVLYNCTHCKKQGHTVESCFFLHGFPKDRVSLIFEKVRELNIDNVVTLAGVVSLIFDKAVMQPTLCEKYANFCSHLATELPDFSVDNEKITFRRLLLNKCQEEFERGEREEQEANEADGEGEIKQSEQEREEKRPKVRRRMLGNIRFIGELYKKRMLTERIMHECIKKLLGDYHSPDEENIEALCKLMSTIGEMIDHPKVKEHMDAYFDIMRQLSNNMNLSSRVRFMLRDAIDMRKNKWQQRRKVEGPKKIDKVHRDAIQERLGQSARLNRGPSMNPAMRRGQPVEFSPRGPMLSTPVGQGGGFRGTSQVRGYAMQDARTDDRNAYESRTLSVPLLQRSGNDQPITLGPHGLARGMAFRGQPSVSSSPLLDTSASYGDPKRTAGGSNGYSAALDRGAYSSREDQFAKHSSERFGGPGASDQSTSQEHNANRDLRNPNQNADESRPTTPSVGRAGGSPAQNLSSETVWPEERLREKSISAIKEYYSAKDEKEIALCMNELNAPSFYPVVVSTWVSDSFERKDKERDSLAQLLVNLTKPQEGLFTPAQLIEGFQSVLSNLEDTVNDAPRAPEFLGRIFGNIVVENVITLKEVGRLIYEGGEELGSLLQVGLAGDVLASILEMIKSEKGESTMNEIHAASNLKLEDFRPPAPIRSRKLEMFIKGW